MHKLYHCILCRGVFRCILFLLLLAPWFANLFLVSRQDGLSQCRQAIKIIILFLTFIFMKLKCPRVIPKIMPAVTFSPHSYRLLTEFVLVRV